MKQQKEKQLPPLEISVPIEINGNRNNYSVKVPDVGQLIDIETSIFSLKKGTDLIANGTKSAYLAHIASEMIATYNIMIPKLKKDLNVESLLDLNPHQTKKMLRDYLEIFRPWWDSWIDIFNDTSEISDLEKKEEK